MHLPPDQREFRIAKQSSVRRQRLVPARRSGMHPYLLSASENEWLIGSLVLTSGCVQAMGQKHGFPSRGRNGTGQTISKRSGVQILNDGILHLARGFGQIAAGISTEQMGQLPEGSHRSAMSTVLRLLGDVRQRACQQM